MKISFHAVESHRIANRHKNIYSVPGHGFNKEEIKDEFILIFSRMHTHNCWVHTFEQKQQKEIVIEKDEREN